MFFVNRQLRSPRVSTSPDHPFAFTTIQRQDGLPAHVSERIHRPETNQRARDVFPQPQVDMARGDDESPENEDFPPDLNGCFSSEGFDPKQFEEFARDFLSRECLMRQEFESQRKEKAKIVSVLAQNLYITCTLSKDQIKHHPLLEGDDHLQCTRVCRHRQKNPRKLLKLFEIRPKKTC